MSEQPDPAASTYRRGGLATQRQVWRRAPVVGGAVLAAAVLSSQSAWATPGGSFGRPTEDERHTLTGRPVIRDGFHFQVSFGLGGGPDSVGVFHAMEIGGTFENGMSISLLHTFIQNKDVFSQRGGPDLFGGWMPQFKFPLFYDDLIWKVAIGPGGIHRQDDGIEADVGLGWTYGVDFHTPLGRRSGLTTSAQALHVQVNDKHHFGVASALGYTLF